MEMKGNEQWWEEGLASGRSALFSYVLSITRNREQAEDITQEAMLRACRRISRLKDHNSLMPWLYRIATNICRDHFRRTTRRREKDQIREEVHEVRDKNRPGLDRVFERLEMGECVQRYFAELPHSCRAVILLHDVEGMTNQEIADMLGISLAAAKIRLHRCRKKIRAILQDACHLYTDERGVLVCESRQGKIGQP